MQVYQRISNPYMPNGNAGATNAPSPAYAPGEVGCAFNDQQTGLTYLRVWLDSGATSATTVGAVAANQLAYWKDRQANIVTNDPNFNDTGAAASCIDRVAGVFQTAVKTAAGTNDVNGNPVKYLCDLAIGGQNVPVKAAQGAVTVPGAAVIADGVTAGVKTVATISTAPTQQNLGTSRSSTVSAAGTINVDLAIGFIQ